MEAELERAWLYHQAADTLLITRVQSLLLAQSFLVVAYATLTANWDSTKTWPYILVMILICTMGITSAGLVMWANRKLADGIKYLKDVLISDPIYANYLKSLRENSKLSQRIFPTIIPSALILFWSALIFLAAVRPITAVFP
jgi:hypothetical protein